MRRIYFILLVLGIVLGSTSSLWPGNHWVSLLPDGDGKQETQQLCGTCHNLQKTVLSRKTQQEWERTVYDMVARGAQIFPDEVELIIKYLVKNYPSDGSARK